MKPIVIVIKDNVPHIAYDVTEDSAEEVFQQVLKDYKLPTDDVTMEDGYAETSDGYTVALTWCDSSSHLVKE